jgi:hypothetical protein
MDDQDAASRYRTNLQGEVDGASLYRALAETEKDPHLSEVYRRLSAVEEAHAEFWRKQLGRLGARVGRPQPGWRIRMLAWLARRFGPQFVLPTISGFERRDSRQYDDQKEAVAGGLPMAERSHNRVIQAVVDSLPGGVSGARWRGSRAATAWAAMRCARRCWGPTTASSPISASSWAWPARPPIRARSC